MNSLARSILIVVLILLLIGSLPVYPWTQNFTAYPAGGLGTVLVVVIVLIVLGKI